MPSTLASSGEGVKRFGVVAAARPWFRLGMSPRKKLIALALAAAGFLAASGLVDAFGTGYIVSEESRASLRELTVWQQKIFNSLR